MNYTKSLLLYQDEPGWGLFLKVIIIGLPGMLLILSIFLMSIGEETGAIMLVVEAFILFLIFWSIFPRSYQVYEDHLRIVLGGPFSMKISFTEIVSVEATNKTSFGINFVTRIVSGYVAINRRRGLRIAITPRDNTLFVESANNALARYSSALDRNGLDFKPF